MSETTNIFGDDPFNNESFVREFPDPESTPLVFMTTAHCIEGSRVSNHHGIVFGESAIGLGLATGVAQSIQSLFGVEANSSERRIEQARRHALYMASEHARTLGGNAIIGTRVDYEFSSTMMFVAVTGTAVTADV